MCSFKPRNYLEYVEKVVRSFKEPKSPSSQPSVSVCADLAGSVTTTITVTDKLWGKKADSTAMINYIEGDLFGHTTDQIQVLAHACNCQGSWGAGVAAVFKKKYPSAYALYVAHCKKHAADTSVLLGTTLLVPTAPTDPGTTNVYVACLFTSDFAGRKKLKPAEIVGHTASAMAHLADQLETVAGVEQSPAGRTVVNMPKINAGLFCVPWEHTETVLQRYDGLDINVYVL